MGNLAVLALRAVIAIALTGSLFVQGVLVPLIWLDMDQASPEVRVPFVAIVVLGVPQLSAERVLGRGFRKGTTQRAAV
jgi:hypothetical protein